jgi:hypothetical protein
MRDGVTGTHIKRVLLVTYVFPPAGGAGVQRITKFVKYLPQLDWSPSVLAPSNPSIPVFDQSLVSDVPADTLVRAEIPHSAVLDALADRQPAPARHIIASNV